jgi:hypothetical protein
MEPLPEGYPHLHYAIRLVAHRRVIELFRPASDALERLDELALAVRAGIHFGSVAVSASKPFSRSIDPAQNGQNSISEVSASHWLPQAVL